jgi:hypothetical protein
MLWEFKSFIYILSIYLESWTPPGRMWLALKRAVLVGKHRGTPEGSVPALPSNVEDTTHCRRRHPVVVVVVVVAGRAEEWRPARPPSPEGYCSRPLGCHVVAWPAWSRSDNGQIDEGRRVGGPLSILQGSLLGWDHSGPGLLPAGLGTCCA